MNKVLHILYFAHLREQSGLDEETVTTDAHTASELYIQLRGMHNFTLLQDNLRVAINNEFSSWSTELKDKDTLCFIPPVAGG